MYEPRSLITQQYSSPQVLLRFVFRLLLLCGVAAFGSPVFVTGFASLLLMSALFCAIMALMRREVIFGPVLTHWDEAAGYAVIGHLATAVS